MKLWVLRQTKNNDYDTYDSAVVAAETEEEARRVHPDGRLLWDGTSAGRYDSWCGAESVSVAYLGETDRDIKGVVVASFNAG